MPSHSGATEDAEQCCPILNRARAFIQKDDTSLSQLQVLEHVPATISSEILPREGMDVIAGMERAARNHLRQLAGQNQLADAEVLVVSVSFAAATKPCKACVASFVGGCRGRHAVAGFFTPS